MKENRKQCLYCQQDLSENQWASEWLSEEVHYKIIQCDCGKKDWVRVDFYGSGHDSFPNELSPLESTVKKVQENYH